ncbi:MAG: hypothetical protein AAF968_18310 [Pseudomonadota bacterium]
MIDHTVWRSLCVPLNLGMIEEMLAERGVVVSHETVWPWERVMKGATSRVPDQRFLSADGRVTNHVRPPTDTSSGQHREFGIAAMATKNELTQTAASADA